MQKTLVIIILLTVIDKCYSQQGEGAFSFNYMMVPIGNDDVDLYKTDVKLNVPVKLNKGKMINSFGFDNFHFNYFNFPINSSELENFYNINYGISYEYPISKKWNVSSRLGVSLASNIESTITAEDLNYNAELIGIHSFGKMKTPTVLAFGFAYTTISGKPRLLPIFNFHTNVNQKFSLGIGFPKTYAKYQLNDRSTIINEIELHGFYSNLSNSVVIDANNISEKASMTSVNIGVSYDYKLDNNWSINLKGGYSIYNNFELLNGNDMSVYEFNTSPKPYFSTGIKFSLKNKLKQKQNDK